MLAETGGQAMAIDRREAQRRGDGPEPRFYAEGGAAQRQDRDRRILGPACVANVRIIGTLLLRQDEMNQNKAYHAIEVQHFGEVVDQIRRMLGL